MRSDWVSIRAKYEAGANQSELSRKYKISRTAIQQHIKSEGWQQDISKSLNQRVEAKLAGVLAGCNSKKAAQALDEEAERRVEIIKNHRKEWEIVEGLRGLALQYAKDAPEESFDRMKLAKITAEVTSIKQAGERKVWGIIDPGQNNLNITAANINANISVETMSDEELGAIVARGISEGREGTILQA